MPDSTDYRELINEKFRGVYARLDSEFELPHTKLDSIEAQISNTGTIVDTSINFNITYNDTSISAGDYLYDITIESSIHKYTIIQDKLTIIDSVKY